jgi:PilZ domain
MPTTDAEVSTVELARGRRVVLELLDGAVVAMIDGAADDVLHLRLLDDLPDPGATPVVTGVLIVDPVGLFLWPARVQSIDSPDAVTVAITGPSTLLQRRRHPRVDVDLAATVRRYHALGLTAPEDATVVDISRGGLRLIGPALEPGDVVKIQAATPRGNLPATGRVVYRSSDADGHHVAHVAFLLPTGQEGVSGVDEYLASVAAEDDEGR